MAGYFMYSFDADAFEQLTTRPTEEQALFLATNVIEGIEESDYWPQDIPALATAIRTHLAKPDWYAGLSEEDAEIWDSVVFTFVGESGSELGLDFQCSDYESIYWDCAEEVVAQGGTMFREPVFGNSGFRFHDKLDHDYGYFRIYSIYTPEQVKKLLHQLQQVEPHFASLTDREEGSVYDQFFEGLLPTIKEVADNKRVLFIQTDT